MVRYRAILSLALMGIALGSACSSSESVFAGWGGRGADGSGRCGDGILDPAESCDDGNEQDGDGCPSTCVRTVATLTLGAHYACVILSDGRMKCWGENADGQLGLGDTNHRGDQPNEMGDHLPAIDLGTGKYAVK